MLATVLAATRLAVACSGGSEDTNGGKDSQGEVLTGDLQAGDPASEAGDSTGIDAAAPCRDNLVIEFFGLEDGMAITKGANVLIQTRIYDADVAEPIPGLEVHFSLEGDGDAALVESVATTDEFGVATVNLNAGSVVDVTYKLTAANSCAGSVSVELPCVPPQFGTLAVSFTVAPDLAARWPNLLIDAYADNTVPLCGAVDFTAPPGLPLHLAQGQTTVEFKEALAGAAYIVLGIARIPGGAAVGAGCQEGVAVLPEKTTDVAVTLNPLGLDLKGQFELAVTADFAGLLAANWVGPGAKLAELMTDSANLITDGIATRLEQEFPGGLPPCGEVDIMENIKNSVLAGLGTMPPEPVAWAAVEGDEALKGILSQVVFSGPLTLEKGANAGQYDAAWEYAQVAFFGPVPCRQGDCGATVAFPADAFSLGDVHLGLEEELFPLQAEGFAQVTTPKLVPSISPGRAALFAFVNTVLPQIGSGNELDNLLAATYDCPSLLTGVSPEVTVCVNKPAALLEGCEAGVAGIKAAFYAAMAPYLGEKKLQWVMDGQSSDVDGDLVADGIEGQLAGDYVVGGMTAGFIFPFKAER
jgi:hypothetical protein